MRKNILQNWEPGGDEGKERCEVEIDFKIVNHEKPAKVVTIRPDLLWGATYLEVSPESKLVDELGRKIRNYGDVKEYIDECQKQDVGGKMNMDFVSSGVQLKGIRGVNPINNEEVSVWMKGGTIPGSVVMGVPAHDEGAWHFAQRFGLPVRQVVATNYAAYKKNLDLLGLFDEVRKRAAKKRVKLWLFGGLAMAFWAGVLYREHDNLNFTLRSESDFKIVDRILKRMSFKQYEVVIHTDKLASFSYKNKEGVQVHIARYMDRRGMGSYMLEKEKELAGFSCLLIDKEFLRQVKKMQIQMKERGYIKDKLDWQYLNSGALVNIDQGVLVNSGELSGLEVEEGRRKVVEWLEKKGVGRRRN